LHAVCGMGLVTSVIDNPPCRKRKTVDEIPHINDTDLLQECRDGDIILYRQPVAAISQIDLMPAVTRGVLGTLNNQFIAKKVRLPLYTGAGMVVTNADGQRCLLHPTPAGIECDEMEKILHIYHTDQVHMSWRELKVPNREGSFAANMKQVVTLLTEQNCILWSKLATELFERAQVAESKAERPSKASDSQQKLPDTERQSSSRSKNKNQTRTASQRIGPQRFGSSRLGSQRIGSPRLGSQRLGSQRLGSQRIGSPRLGSQRIGSQRIDPDERKSEQKSERKGENSAEAESDDETGFPSTPENFAKRLLKRVRHRAMQVPLEGLDEAKRMFFDLDFEETGNLQISDAAKALAALYKDESSRSPEEIKNYIEQVFTTIDTNGDGLVSWEEFVDAFKQLPRKKLAVEHDIMSILCGEFLREIYAFLGILQVDENESFFAADYFSSSSGNSLRMMSGAVFKNDKLIVLPPPESKEWCHTKFMKSFV